MDRLYVYFSALGSPARSVSRMGHSSLLTITILREAMGQKLVVFVIPSFGGCGMH